MSGSCCSPFVVDSQSGCDGSSISFASCCHQPSTQNQLFPLVDFDSLPNPSFPTSVNADDDITTHSADGTVSVACVNHLMSDADLPLGTGPLLNFGRISDEHHTLSSLSVETSLSHSRLLNVSSSPSPALRPIGSIGQSQKMIGVEVSGCTNHLYGTVCDDMNNGGSILCLNSSFSRCSTSLEPSSTFPTYNFQHRSGAEQKFELSITPSSSVSFSHCTFHKMTTALEGGAIVSKSSSQGLSIAACSFVDCSSSPGMGGAVSIDFSSSSPQPVSISSSLFIGCNASYWGGTLYLNSPQTASVTDCCFVGTELNTWYGKCIYLSNSKEKIQICHCQFSDAVAVTGDPIRFEKVSPTIVSFSSFVSCHGSSLFFYQTDSPVDVLNCAFIECNGSSGTGIQLLLCSDLATVKDSLFDKCTAYHEGGGIRLFKSPSIKLYNLKFRDCAASCGKDLAVEITRDEVAEGKLITNCVSTSGANNVYFRNDSPNFDSTLIPQVPSIDVPSITLSALLDGDDVGGTLTVTASESVDGRMLGPTISHQAFHLYLIKPLDKSRVSSLELLAENEQQELEALNLALSTISETTLSHNSVIPRLVSLVAGCTLVVEGPSQIVSSIVHPLLHSLTADTHFSTINGNKIMIVKSDGLPTLVRLLSRSPILSLPPLIPQNALTTLWNCARNEEIKDISRSVGASISSEVDLQTIETALGSLLSLTVNGENKSYVREHNGLPLLVSCLARVQITPHTPQHIPVLHTALTTLRNCCSNGVLLAALSNPFLLSHKRGALRPGRREAVLLVKNLTLVDQNKKEIVLQQPHKPILELSLTSQKANVGRVANDIIRSISSHRCRISTAPLDKKCDHMCESLLTPSLRVSVVTLLKARECSLLFEKDPSCHLSACVQEPTVVELLGILVGDADRWCGGMFGRNDVEILVRKALSRSISIW
ncbi:hypothetical protein BLNAU_9871 [Blattamonas nauphoetae]|uniref:Right handed beta helix domain-containing protein n=1 Tax=Blattamonas nauphoetae TaxID=2049346 RepID=A0ABQ9XUI0_9EUKA|nr:hypothetical protein BLNAU_9871 [Blattamonas nauphoetae]